MMRSLYSGVSGLKNHQTRMDVIGNNIANVNTIGYKKARTVFTDIFSQNLQTASAGDYTVNTTTNAVTAGGFGGTNPIQVGLGVQLSTIDIIHTPAAVENTSNPTDLAISGDGLFVICPPDLTGDNYLSAVEGTPVLSGSDFVGTHTAGFYYTRAGNFYRDNAGHLVDSKGNFVMGYQINTPTVDTGTGLITGSTVATTPNVLTKINLAGLNGIAVDDKGIIYATIGEEKVAIAQVGLAMFTNFSGLEKLGDSYYGATTNSGQAFVVTASKEGAGKISPGKVEMSNVDLGDEFTNMIVTQRGFQANSRVITVSDTMLEELVNLKR